jgi:hypothetical protein
MVTPTPKIPTRRPIAYGMSGAAQAVDLSPTKLRLEIAARRLRACKVGRRTLITANDLEEWAARLPDIHEVTLNRVAKRVARAAATDK